MLRGTTMQSEDRSFIYGTPRMALNPQNARVPFTRFNIRWNKHPPYAAYGYASLFDQTAAMSRRFADESLARLMEESAARTHAGQSSAGLIASGLSASALRVPEIRTGSLVAVSL
jgi:hypothetical protein